MLTLPAPAKLNLYLHITGKRSDGYHLLDTVFQLIDLSDTVRLSSRSDGVIRLHTPIVGLPDAQHLAIQAAHCLQSHTGCGLGADIWVEKTIPSGAGLGGGSSDAASTLIGLNHLWHCGLTSSQLQTLGLSLGADVPFFCSTLGAAHATGVGETLTALETEPKSFIVVYPNCHVATPSVFKHPRLQWDSKRARALPFTPYTPFTFTHAFAPGLSNDLQTPATQIAPAIEQAIDWLSAAPNCEGVRMSGSGSAVFAQFASHQTAQQGLAKLMLQRPDAATLWSAWLVKSMAEHPAIGVLSAY
jgi:4-diphosphocytidyl-2-C-methyl-D-erythritol kinase